MTPQTLLQEGKLGPALAALQEAVRKDAANPTYRVFLFQLLCVLGQWNRALTQLNVAGELDAGTLPMVQTYREAIQCEGLRVDIFKGARAPLIFGEPQPWLVLLIEALKADAAGDTVRAALIRHEAFAQAPAVAGSIDGEPFAWLADADGRLGPVLEAIVNGRYFWIPFARISRIELEPPADLRDSVWTPATFTWVNGAQTVGLIPTRYDATTSGLDPDPALLLARRTEWGGADAAFGIGQRMFVTDQGEHALMDVRLIEFHALAGAETPEASEAGAAHG